MGRKTKQVLHFLLALTCISDAKRHRNEWDTELFLENGDEDDGIFATSPVEKSGIPIIGGRGKVLYGKKDIYKQDVDLMNKKERRKRKLSTIYNTDDFKSAFPPPSESILSSDSYTESRPNPDEIRKVPLAREESERIVLKGILRKHVPGSPAVKSNKHVTFQRRPQVFYYDLNDHLLQADDMLKCGGTAPNGQGGGYEGSFRYARRPPMKPTRSLKEGLRHLFYQ